MMMTLAAVLCCAMTNTVFTACSSDDDDNNSKKEKDAPATARMECKLYTSDESLASFDFYVKYYDANGQVQSEKITWSDKLDELNRRTWTMNVTAKLPATLGVLFEVKAKDGIDYNAKHVLARGFDITFSSYTASNYNIEFYKPASSYKSSGVKAGELESALVEYGQVVNIIEKYDTNGKGTVSTWN